jgi:hypothetical protein
VNGRAYYNEIDPFAAQWLRNLIAAGHIAPGEARRVKPGIRLLAHGVSGRVGKLRGFGNAIDPRPAAQFILAADEAIRGAS